MTKKLLLLVTMIVLSIQMGCTSNQSEDETEVIENADVEKIEAEDSLAENGDPMAAEVDSSMQAALGEGTPVESENLDAAPLADTATNDVASSADTAELPTDVAAAPTLDEASLNDVPAPVTADGSAEAPTNITDSSALSLEPEVDSTAGISDIAPPAEVAAAPVESTEQAPIIENSGTNTAMAEAPAAPVSNPNNILKKIALTTPYQTPAGWVNAVYVARPGETLKDISQKIFATDKVKDLKKIAENNYLKWRAVNPGDKVYYVSPNRPDDSAKTLFYYEDMGMVPETYVAKKGDNLKKVAKEILGYKKAYVEMWTANSVESKGKLAEGETLRYWRSASGVTETVANNISAVPSGSAQLIDQNQASQYTPPADTSMPPPEMPTAETAATEMPPTPSQDTASFPPPSDQPMPAMDSPPADVSASLPPPPPPPPPDIAPPPVETIAETKPEPTAGDEQGAIMGGLDEDTMMSLGAVGVLTAALAFALIRRKKKKEAEMSAAMNDTHVGT